MKFIVYTMLGAMLITPGAHAASDTTVEVSGRLFPGACTVSLDNGGRFDFGNIPAKSLLESATTFLTPIETTVHIDCQSDTAVGIGALDVQAGTQVALPIPSYEGITDNFITASFGLGLADGKKIGAYMIELDKSSFTEEGVPIPLVYALASNSDLPWTPVTTQARFHKGLNLYGFGHSDIEPIKSVSGTLRISPAIAHNQGMTFADQIVLDGQATLVLMYH